METLLMPRYEGIGTILVKMILNYDASHFRQPSYYHMIITKSFTGLLQTYEFHFQRCEIQFQTNVNRIQCYAIEYHTIVIKFQSWAIKFQIDDIQFHTYEIPF